ncbi:MAG: tol-pal system protein YbgF [Candidatus Thiodiazotropha taylori]|nr:tol-pal system protein YbgF [Candidatus Thiodiazotropha taylori]
MNSRIRLAIIGLAIGLGTSTPMLAAENGPNMEQRLQRIERMLQNQSLADLVLQLQQLQREVQQLRGDVELQKHTMDAMSRRQRDLYLDIDQRLSRFQSGGVVTPPPVSQPAPAPAAAPMPQQGATAPVASMDTMANAAVTPPDPQQEEMVYQEAFNLLKQGRYPESITAFSAFLKDYSGGTYEDNAQYWLAEASYVNRDFDTALAEFTKVRERYTQSPKVPGAMLKMGYIHYEKKQWDEAKKILRELQLNYPATTEARLAEKRIQRITKEGR